VTLITNGWLLEERWPELRGTVDALVLSVDDEPAAHDRMRGLPGLSARMEAAVERVNLDARRPRLLVNTVLSRENPGALVRVAPTVRRWGAGWYFCPMETGRMLAAGFDASRAGLALPGRELARAAAQAGDLRRRGYPLLNSPRYVRTLEQDPRLDSYRCRAPRAVLTVEADGSVRDCRRRDVALANVADLRRVGLPLSHVYSLPRYRSMLEEAGSCTACNNPDVVETSWLWDLHPSMVSRIWRLTYG
jgi:MoaA/NifB/PqqE/SkfB family radical SAM enzyme